MVTAPIVVDLSHSSHERGYIARVIWQQLFVIYRSQGGDLDNMDSLLCDLRIIERRLGCDSMVASFYWTMGPGGYTDIKDSPECSDGVMVSFDHASKTLTIEEG